MTTERSFDAYFGEAWPSGICDEGHQVETPTGEQCNFCGEAIVGGDRGSFVGVGMFDGAGTRLLDLAPVHRECCFREVMGGWGHHVDHAYWCGQMDDPDGGLTRRQSSLKVWEHVTVAGA